MLALPRVVLVPTPPRRQHNEDSLPLLLKEEEVPGSGNKMYTIYKVKNNLRDKPIKLQLTKTKKV